MHGQPKIEKKIVKLIDYTYACNSLTIFVQRPETANGSGGMHSQPKIEKNREIDLITLMPATV